MVCGRGLVVFVWVGSILFLFFFKPNFSNCCCISLFSLFNIGPNHSIQYVYGRFQGVYFAFHSVKLSILSSTKEIHSPYHSENSELFFGIGIIIGNLFFCVGFDVVLVLMIIPIGSTIPTIPTLPRTILSCAIGSTFSGSSACC